MALLVCCPCGNPIDCNHLELVVTLACPRCQRELTLEVESAGNRRCFCILTVMDGPYWVGEQFVLPVGEELLMGKGAANWLSLESDVLSDVHCKLRLWPDGRVDVESLSDESDTWIGESCVAKGRLKPQGSLKIGEYRFRLDFKDAVGGEFISHEADPESSDASPLPTLLAVVRGKSRLNRIVRIRFQVMRWLLAAFAWPVAVDHVLTLRSRGVSGWQWALVGLGVLVVLLVSAQWVNLANRYRRYGSLGSLALLALLDMAAWRMPFSAIAALVLASALALFFTRSLSPLMAACAALLGVCSVVMAAALALRAVFAVIG